MHQLGSHVFIVNDRGIDHLHVPTPKQINLIENESDIKDTPNDPKGNETEEVGPLEGLEALMVLTKSTPVDEKKRL